MARLEQQWTLTFHGSVPKCVNHANETLELFCQFEYELLPLTRDFVKRNVWFVNPTGLVGGYSFGDVTLERQIKELKGRPGAKQTQPYNGPFFQNIIAPNVLAFQAARRAMQEQLGLTPRSGNHGILAGSSIFTKLLADREAAHVHQSRPGWTQKHRPRDDETEGARSWRATRVSLPSELPTRRQTCASQTFLRPSKSPSTAQC